MRPVIDHEVERAISSYYSYVPPVLCKNPKKNNLIKLNLSYGILCVSLDGLTVIMTESPAYFAQQNNYRYAGGNFSLNSNLRYNLLLSSFPNGIVEGQYSLPRGKPDPIDNDNVILTKIREFMEETKLYHPKLLELASEHYRDPNYKSFFTDNTFTVTEEWQGLNNVTYRMQYSIFVIPSMDELKAVSGGCIGDFITDNMRNNIPASVRKIFLKKYDSKNRIDCMKKLRNIPLSEALFLMNTHKLKRIKSVTVDQVLSAIKKYRLHNKF